MAFYIFLLLVIGEFPGNFPHALSSAADEPVLRHRRFTRRLVYFGALFATHSQVSLLKRPVFLHGLHSMTLLGTQLEHRVSP